MSTEPEPLGLRLSTGSNQVVLPSSVIQRNTLLPVHQVFEKYLQLMAEGNAGTLAQKLAKEAIFGSDIMRRCTPSGIHGGLPALPQVELFQLKRVIFKLRCSNQFESIWKKCIVAIAEACKHLSVPRYARD